MTATMTATGTETRSPTEIKQEVEQESKALALKQGQMAQLLRDLPRNAEGIRTPHPYQADQLRTLEDECRRGTERVNSLKLDYVQARTEEDLLRRQQESIDSMPRWTGAGGGPDGGGNGDGATKAFTLGSSLGDLFIQSAGFKSWRHGAINQSMAVDLDQGTLREHAIKATLTTSGLTSYFRPPEVVELGQQMLTIADLFAQGQTAAPTIRHLREVSLTNAAAAVAEGGLKPEMTWDLAEVDTLVRKIAVTTKVTDEMLADFAQTRTYINSRLPFLIRQREEFQLLTGDGISPNLLGILNTPGILTQARGTDTNVDAIYKGITKVRTEGFFEPDAVVIHPTNWTSIRLLKTTTGEYVWGAPSVVGPETIFGKPVVTTVNMTANTALVGSFKVNGTVFYREGLRIEATNSNEDDFKTNLILLRAEQREGLVVWRPSGFCTVTGLST